MTDINDIQRRINSDQKKLHVLKHSEHISRIKNDISLRDAIYDMQDQYEGDEFDKVQNLALKIYNSTRSKNVSYESNPVDEFNEFIKQGKSKTLPEWFGLNRKPKKLRIFGGAMVMVGARPKCGKSSLAVNIAAWNNIHNIKTLFMSNEMKPIDIRIKLFQNYIYRTKNLVFEFMDIADKLMEPANDIEHQMLADFKDFNESLLDNVVILDARQYTTNDYCMAMDNSINLFGEYPAFTILDYVQRIKGEGKTMRDVMINASREILSKVHEVNTILIALSQMNKDGDYKESGVWEEDATVNIVLERDYQATGTMKIIVKSSRFTTFGETDVTFSVASGAIGE